MPPSGATSTTRSALVLDRSLTIEEVTARIAAECSPSPQIEHLLEFHHHVRARDRTRVSKLRTAVVGVGYLGRFHAQKYRALDDVELVGVCDRDAERGRSVATEVGATRVRGSSRARRQSGCGHDRREHGRALRRWREFFLEHGVHVLVEKPMTRTSAEAAVLTKLAAERGLKLQVGHVERFNPALLVGARRR